MHNHHWLVQPFLCYSTWQANRCSLMQLEQETGSVDGLDHEARHLAVHFLYTHIVQFKLGERANIKNSHSFQVLPV